MKDVNNILRKKLFDILNGNISASVYNDYLPASINPSAYVIVTWMTSNDNSGMVNANTITSFQLGIYTKDTAANSGQLVNTIAQEIYALIYPEPNSIIDLSPDLQNVTLQLASDDKPMALQTNNAVFINRFLTFRTNIYHKNV